MVAAKRVPAIPARTRPAHRPARLVASAAVRRSMRTGSGPHNGSRPSTWTSNSPNAASLGSARAGETRAERGECLEGGLDRRRVRVRIRIEEDRLRCEPVGAPERDPPPDAERPGVRVRVDDRPGSHGRPPRTSGPGGKGSEARAIASSRGRWGR